MSGFVIYRITYSIIHALRAIGWWHWSVEGRENLPPRADGGMIVITNHTHWLDIPVIGAMLPFAYRLSWLGKSEIFTHPIARWFFTTMNVIPINRGRRDTAALDVAEQAIRAGAILLIYPEGHRSRTGNLQQGRGGAVRLAMRSQRPIVPIAIVGTESGLRGTLLGKPVRIRIGKPYIVEPTPDGKIPPALMESLTTDMMLRIAQLLPPDKRGYYANALQDTVPTT